MRIATVSAIALLFVSTLSAQQIHQATPVDQLIEGDHAHHGLIAEMPVATADAVAPAAAKSFNITARRFSYSVNPSAFVVNQGDTVTLNITAADTRHGFLLESYDIEAQINAGQRVTRTFVANTPGTFTFFCTVFCGEGHGQMSGTFTVVAATTPSITSIEPPGGPTSGGTVVAIAGSNFASGANVNIGGLAAANVSVTTTSSISATTPLGPFDIAADSPRDVTVTNPDGSSVTRNAGFTWTLPPPLVTSIVPSAGSPKGGAQVMIAGAGFTTGLPVSVSFGGAAATAVEVTGPTTLTATLPAHPAGAVDVVVTVGSNTFTAARAFSYFEAGKRRAVKH